MHLCLYQLLNVKLAHCLTILTILINVHLKFLTHCQLNKELDGKEIILIIALVLKA